MKKNKLFILTTIILSAFVPFLFTGCFDPIFNTIRKDVKPEKATVSGNITSIARYKAGNAEFLVLSADGGLRYKRTGNNSHGNWNTYNNLPFRLIHHDFDSNSYKGEQIIKVVADDTHLYLVTIQYKPESYIPTSPKIWAVQMDEGWSAPSSAWTDITTAYSINLPIDYPARRAVSHFNVFHTNDINSAHRRAYIRIGDSGDITYYELDGTKAPKKITPSSANPANDTSKSCLNSAVWFKDKVLFFNSPAAVTNATASTDATHVYYGNGNDLFYSSDGSSFNHGLSVGAYIGSIAVCSDAILFGCGNPMTGGAGGIRKTTLSNGIPGSGLTDFSTNANFQLPAAYMITTLLNENPANSELTSALYASVTFPGVPSSGNSKFEDKGLWSFYPERGNWNRE